MTRTAFYRIGALSLLVGALSLSALNGIAGSPPENPFYAMDTNLRDGVVRTPEDTARLLSELGYAGYGHGGTQNIPEWLEALDRHGLKMFNTYVGIDLNEGGRIDPAILEILPQFRGRDTMIWLYVQGNRFSRTEPSGDELAVRTIRELADYAHLFGVRIALYPHTWFYVENVDDALRIARKVNRRNVGVTLNLCHWLKVDGAEGMEALMRRALPYLFQVSINGADAGETREMNWDRLIQPLGKGSYDAGAFVRALRELGYRGSIGLQGYGIPGDSVVNLRQSIDAWRKLSP